MINIHINEKGEKYVIASELHSKLLIKSPLRKWFPRMMEYGFEENEDYIKEVKKVRLAQGGYNVKNDWNLTLDMAKEIAMIQRTPQGKAIRNHLLNLDRNVQDGKYITEEQADALIDLSQVLGYFSVQKFVETEHYKIYDGNENWWTYRARLFGYSSKELKARMKAIGKRYKSQRQALMHLDKKQLIRQASIDLFKAMGKSDEYAANMTKFIMKFAELKEPEIYNDIGIPIDFKSNNQKATIKHIQQHNDSPSLLRKFG